jgi:Secretion system C-terminal sorting domain
LKGGGSAWNEYVYGISVDNLGNTFVTGGYSSNSYFGADTIALIGYYDIFVSKINLITGIDEIENNSFNVNIYPNPFNNELNVKVNENGKYQITLYDIASRKLLQQTFTNKTTISTEQLAKGIYLYQVRNENGINMNGKVIKQ